MKVTVPAPSTRAKQRRARRPPIPITTPLMRAWQSYRALERILDEIDHFQPEPARRVELEAELAAARVALTQREALLLADFQQAMRLLLDLEWLFASWMPAAKIIDLAKERRRRAGGRRG